MLRALLATILLILPRVAGAHEFWIEPLMWQIAPGESLQADTRLGQNMKGAPIPLLPSAAPRFEVVTPSGVLPVNGLIGDKPALNMPSGGPGLYVIVHETRDYLLKYDDFARFRDFVTHKDLGDTLSQHALRGLPETGFTERYHRYAKSLVAVGDGHGQDAPVGFRTELVALANPYVDDLTRGFPVSLTFEGAPRQDAQIEVFERDKAGEVTSFMVRTDTDGRAVVPVKPGLDYMLDAVVMLPLEPPAPGDPVWHSLWANLTFHVPGK